MNLLLFGENCTGKSTIAKILEKEKNMKVYSGKDYLRLAKNPNEALNTFKGLLENDDEKIIFVAAEKEHIEMAPDRMIKVLFTESLKIKKERFSLRFRGNLPKPVELMLERKHGMFDDYYCDLRFTGDKNIEEVIYEIENLLI